MFCHSEQHSPSPPSRTAAAATAGLAQRLARPLLVAIAIRLVLFMVYQPWQPEIEATRVIQGDEIMYHTAAMNISRGHGYSFRTAAPYTLTNFRMPGYPLFLSVLYRIGCRPWGALLAHIGFSALTLLLLAHLCASVWNMRTAVICAWLMALCPLDIVSTQTLLREPLFLVFLSGFWCLWLWYLRQPRLWALCASAALMALASYVRDNSIYMVVAFAPLLVVRGWSERRVLRGVWTAGLFVLCYCAVLAPWAVRNRAALGCWSLTSAAGTTMLTGNGALVLAHKYHYDYDQMLHVLHQVMLKRYSFPPLPPEIQAGLRGAYRTNDALVAAVTPAWFQQTNMPLIVLRDVNEIDKAHARLFGMIVRDNWQQYLFEIVRGTVRILFTPLWQEFMRIALPDVDSGAFVSACIHRDRARIASIGRARAALALGSAALMTAYDVTVGLLALSGLALLAWTWRRRDIVFTLSWLMFFVYTVAVSTGPNAVSRFRYGLLPVLLPLAASMLAWLWTEKSKPQSGSSVSLM